jgi:hypothetical protein
MMKKPFSLATILATATLTSGVMLVSMNAAQACYFGKNKGLTSPSSGNSPTFPFRQSNSDNTNIIKMGLIGVGITALGGLLMVGVVYKVRRAGQEANKALAEGPLEEFFEPDSFPIVISPKTLSASICEQETSESTNEKDLTLVG